MIANLGSPLRYGIAPLENCSSAVGLVKIESLGAGILLIVGPPIAL
jgi:hypothetical protein